jgi:hypothetical protein
VLRLLINNLHVSPLVLQDHEGSFVLNLPVSVSRDVPITTEQLDGILQQLTDTKQKGWISWSVVNDAEEPPPSSFRTVNGDNVSLPSGTPVTSVSGSIRRASTATTQQATVIGIVVIGADPGQSMYVQSTGLVNVDDWSGVTSTEQPLLPSNDYYLGSTPGTLTTTPDTSEGVPVTLIGRALSATQLDLSSGLPNATGGGAGVPGPEGPEGPTGPQGPAGPAGSPALTVASVLTSSTTLAQSSTLVRVDPTAGGFNLTLPSAASHAGLPIIVKNTTDSANIVTLLPAGSDTVESSTSVQLSGSRFSVSLVSDGVSDWIIR